MGVCEAVLARGWRRVILLGAPAHMTDPAVRKPLAASGVLVLVPGEADRARIGEMLASSSFDEAWLSDLLSHGLEHGAEAVVVLDATLAEALGRLSLPVPVLAYT